MRASDWTPTLPARPGRERESAIFTAIADQSIVHDWHVLPLTYRGRKLIFGVSRDALRVGQPGDSVRVTVTARTQAAIADVMGARLLTPRLADIIHCEASVTVPPITRTWFADGSMALTRRMVEQSKDVDALVAGASGLVSGACKDWVICNALRSGKAANYGWHTKASNASPAVTAGLRVWQGVGTAHNLDHVDYSQGVRLVSRAVKVDGIHMDLDDLLRDPDLAGVISHEGPLRSLDPRDAEADTVPAPAPRASSHTQPAVRLGDVPGVAFIQARNYTPAKRTSVDLVVIHDMEAAESRSTAENVAKWFAGPSAPKASAHYNVDSDSIIQSVREHDVAWHAKQANRVGIGIEHAGYAKQTAAQWLDDYGRDMLTRSAELVAGICKRWGIPIVKLTPEQVRAGARGICGHHDVSLAYKTPGGHWDPGPHFPWTWYIEQVKKHV